MDTFINDGATASVASRKGGREEGEGEERLKVSEWRKQTVTVHESNAAVVVYRGERNKGDSKIKFPSRINQCLVFRSVSGEVCYLFQSSEKVKLRV